MFRMPNLPLGRRAAMLGAASLVTAAALALTGCSGTSTSGTSDSEPDVLRIATVAPPVSLDPYLQNVDPVNIWFIALAYDPLIRVDSSGEYVPDLATEWKYLDEANTQFQLTIRDGLGLEHFYEPLGYRAVGRHPRAVRVADHDYRDETMLVLDL